MPQSGAGSHSFALRALAVGCAVYVAALAAASRRPDPIHWGIHLPGFLDPLLRAAVLAAAAGGVIWLWLAAWGPSTARSGRKAARKRRSAAWLPPLLLAAYAVVLYWLRTRTQLLGDGIVWLNALRGEESRPFNEPLAAALWKGFASAVEALGLPPGASSYAILPVLCGVATAAISWRLVDELADDGVARATALGLILTAGFTQLHFGYIESYPIVSTALFATTWLLLRHARGADRAWLPAIALSTAVGIHLVALTLAPAYAVAVWRRPGSWKLRAALLALPVLLAPAILLFAGTRPENWIEPFRTASTGSASGVAAPYLTRPYAALSLAHATDVLQGILLAIPLAAMALAAAGLALAWRAARREEPRPPSLASISPRGAVLAAAAAPGFLLACALMLPVSPAQDWDLTAVLLIPAGIAGAAVAARIVGNTPKARVGALAVATASLLAFVLVNANVRAGVDRFAVLMGPGARVSAYGLGYGNSVLSEYFEDQGAFKPALEYAERALEAERTNARFWLRQGTIYYKMERYDEAQEYLEESIRRGTVRSGAHYNLGLCYVRKGRLDDAVAQFRAAVDMSPNRPDYRHNLGLALYLAGRTDSARVVWTDVLRRWPGYDLTARAMGRRFGSTPPPR